jgi:hypothetical protein
VSGTLHAVASFCLGGVVLLLLGYIRDADDGQPGKARSAADAPRAADKPFAARRVLEQVAAGGAS